MLRKAYRSPKCIYLISSKLLSKCVFYPRYVVCLKQVDPYNKSLPWFMIYVYVYTYINTERNNIQYLTNPLTKFFSCLL